MKSSLLFTLAAVIVATLNGCTTTPVLRPPSAKLRDNLGQVAVVALTNSPRIRYQVPESKAEVAAETHSFETVSSSVITGSNLRVSSAPEAAIVGAMALSAPLVVMSSAPLLHEIRRAYGLVVADSAAAIATSRATMDAAVRPIRFELQLRNRVMAELRQKTPNATLVDSSHAADTLIELMVQDRTRGGRLRAAKQQRGTCNGSTT